MSYYKKSRILPTILTVLVIVIAIAGFVTLIRFIFGGSGDSSRPAKNENINVVQQNLLNTNSGHAVSMTVRGPIVADEDFKSYRITISPDSRRFESFSGYLSNGLDKKTLTNNTAAYTQFVHALDLANLAVGKPLSEDENKLDGICATGRIYQFDTIVDSEVADTLWTSTCKGSKGSLKANIDQLTRLFYSQIPDGSSIEDTLNLRSL